MFVLAANSVSVAPGRSVVTTTPWGASSARSPAPSCRTKPRVAAYKEAPGREARAVNEEVIMILPDPRSLKTEP
jgi:hypothetical protein